MEQLERHHLAVLKDDLIVGIVSACDLLDLVSTDRLLVEDVMSSPVVGIDYRRPVAEASDLMEQLERHHLAVLKDDLIVGIVSACDLLDLVLIDDY
jgi:CBS domain-containing protein